MNRLAALVLVTGAALWPATVGLTQEDPVQAELDAYWAEIVRSVVEWDFDAQKAGYHPDAVTAQGTADSYSIGLMTRFFEMIEADPDFEPPTNPGVEFRFSSRVHDADSAHEVGMYHFWADGLDEFFGTIEAYLVKKDGRWMSLVDIRLAEDGRSRAEWDALESDGS